MSTSLQPHEQQYPRLLCPSLFPGVCSDSSPSSCWCYLNISSSAMLFSTCPQFSQHKGLFIWASSSHQVAKILELQLSISPSNECSSWSSLGLTGLIFSLSKRLSRVFSSTRILKHQFFSAQHSLWSNSPTHTWLLEKPYGPLTYGPLSAK